MVYELYRDPNSLNISWGVRSELINRNEVTEALLNHEVIGKYTYHNCEMGLVFK